MKRNNDSADQNIQLHASEHGTLTIFDLPPHALPHAEALVRGLQAQRYMVHLLQGADRPDGMTSPYGVWPELDTEAIDFMRKETGLVVERYDAAVEHVGRTALTAA